tara:strand:- start:913 stop:2046 length:1134 start_codon:yes stop_codon:yes gene_type:complete
MIQFNEQALLDAERAALQKIQDAGYQSPYNEFANVFQIGDNKRYIEDLLFVEYGAIAETQVSVHIVDKNRCREELRPLIERYGLQNPPLVERTAIPGKLRQITGHHRAYTLDMMGEKIPVIVASKPYNTKGDKVPADLEIITGVQANPPQKHRSYTMEDAVYALSQALKLEPYQEGKNPSGKLPPRHSDDEFDFDDFVDRIFGCDYFPFKGTRSKIYNKLLRGTVRSKLIDIDEAEQTAHLRRIGWSDGLRAKTKKRKEAYEHYDCNRNCLVVVSDNNGKHLEEKLVGILKRYHAINPDYKNGLANNKITFIDIAGRIYNPSSDKASLDAARNNFKDKVTDWRGVFLKAGVNLTIRNLAFPKQLKSSTDVDQIIKIH